MLPPLFPRESPKLEIELANTEVLAGETAALPAGRSKIFSSVHSGFWIMCAGVATVFGLVAFLAIGIVTSSPSDSVAHSGTGDNSSNMGNVYGTWTDIPQDLPANTDTIFNAAELELKVADIINKHDDHTFGVIVAPVGAGDQVRVHDEHIFTGASTTKLLTAVAVLAGIDSGKWRLDHVAYELHSAPTKTETQELEPNSTIMPTPPSSPTPTPTPTPTPKPTPVTIEQALQRMINRSDNVAWEKLIAMVGTKSLRQLAADVGMQDYDVINNRISPRDMALLLQKLYSGQLLSESSKSLLLSHMQKTNEERMIPAAITERGEVYHKYGWLGSVVHDVGVVDNFGKPVIVVLMSDGQSSFANRTTVIRELAEVVEQALQSDN